MEETKREIEIREFECPFCGYKKGEKVNDTIFNEQTGEAVGYGIDYWECDKCGAANDIDLENFEDGFKVFREFTDKDDWKGLYEHCKKNDYDGFILSSLAKLYNQQRKFTKAINLAKTLIRLDPKDPDANIIIENAELGIKNGREI